MNHFIILPTMACNFRCSYCYEKHQNKVMSEDIVSAIALLIARKTAETTALHISWFGGEPLLEPTIINRIMSICNSYASGNKQAEVFSDITTNGWLLDQQCFTSLLNNRITTFQVTLDGLPKQHNQTRRLASGYGTFSKILSNLLAASSLDSDFTLIIRIHITDKNQHDISKLLTLLNQLFGSDPRFKFFIKPVSNLGGKLHEPPTRIDDKSLKDLYSSLPPIKPENIFSADSASLCYASNPHSLVFLPDGRIGKCTVALEDERNIVGHIDRQGRLNLNSSRIFPWIGDRLNKNNPPSCPWKDIKLL